MCRESPSWKNATRRYAVNSLACVSRRYAGDLLLRVLNVLSICGLLRFECSIHAFSWNNRFTLVLKNERRILTVENENINLITEGPFAVHDVLLSQFRSGAANKS